MDMVAAGVSREGKTAPERGGRNGEKRTQPASGAEQKLNRAVQTARIPAPGGSVETDNRPIGTGCGLCGGMASMRRRLRDALRPDGLCNM